MTEKSNLNSNLIPCACGCGEYTHAFDKKGRPRKYKYHHHLRTGKFWDRDKKIQCICGCGELIDMIDYDGTYHKYKKGHQNRGKRLSEEVKEKLRTVTSKEKNWRWNGGKTKTKSGYVYVLRKDHPYAEHHGYVREHRLIMEQCVGRYLEPHEVVHHKNGIKDDNRIENLELMTKTTHTQHHVRKEEELKNRVCCMCGSSKTRGYHRESGYKSLGWYKDKNEGNKWNCKKCYEKRKG